MVNLSHSALQPLMDNWLPRLHFSIPLLGHFTFNQILFWQRAVFSKILPCALRELETESSCKFQGQTALPFWHRRWLLGVESSSCDGYSRKRNRAKPAGGSTWTRDLDSSWLRSATRSSPSARSVVEDEPRPKVDLVDKHLNCDKDFEEHSDCDCDFGPRRLRKRKKSVAAEFCYKRSLAH